MTTSSAALLRIGLSALLLGSWAFGQQNGSSAMPLDSIVSRMEAVQAQLHSSGAYQLIRNYRLSGANSSNADSEVVAEVSFAPPSERSYSIQTSKGSSRGEQVVRRILEQETKADEKHLRTVAITSDNYNFDYRGQTSVEGQPCYRLGLQPKRREKDLIAGEALVDQRTFHIRGIEGDLAKTPSWWLKKVHVTLGFADKQGTWVQTNMKAVAEVRMFGPHTLSSRLIDYRGTDVVAANTRAAAGQTTARRRARKADPAYSAVFTR
jgi:hypothetical protein